MVKDLPHKDSLYKVNTKFEGKKLPSLDTLAQLPPKRKKDKKELPSIVKRARSKYYTQAILKQLVHKKDSPLHKQYSRAYHCAEIIIQEGNKLRSRYCNSRICNVCNRIRTAKLMNKYIEPLQALGQTYFTTLTTPNVKKENLRQTVLDLIKTTTFVIRNIREKKLYKFSGIRKIEITYNPETDTYHPHVHVLHDERIGDLIIEEHLKRNPTAHILGQDTRIANSENLNEMFKYAAKFLIKDKTTKNQMNIYSFALDEIMMALDGLRTFQPFGSIRAKKIEDDENEQPELIAETITDPYIIEKLEQFHLTNWQWLKNDWFCHKTNRPLSEYKPPNIYIEYKKHKTYNK